jgi:hypothetical protein
MTREPVCVNAHDRCYEGGPCPYCEVPERKPTLGQMLAQNLSDALSGKITAEQAQANADAWRVEEAARATGEAA